MAIPFNILFGNFRLPFHKINNYRIEVIPIITSTELSDDKTLHIISSNIHETEKELQTKGCQKIAHDDHITYLCPCVNKSTKINPDFFTHRPSRLQKYQDDD